MACSNIRGEGGSIAAYDFIPSVDQSHPNPPGSFVGDTEVTFQPKCPIEFSAGMRLVPLSERL